jgi:hypothetical protein
MPPRPSSAPSSNCAANTTGAPAPPRGDGATESVRATARSRLSTVVRVDRDDMGAAQ